MHQSKDRVLIKQGEGTAYKAPHGVPHTAEKKEQQSREPYNEMYDAKHGPAQQHETLKQPPTGPAQQHETLHDEPAQDGENPDRVFPVHRASGPVPKLPEIRADLAPFHRSVSVLSAPLVSGYSEPSRRDK